MCSCSSARWQLQQRREGWRVLREPEQRRFERKLEHRGGKYRFLDFMGFRFYRNRTTLRKGIMVRMTRRAKRFKKNPTIYSCRRMMSALGWIKQTDSYDMYLDRIKPYINFQQLKRKISRYDRRIRKEKLCGE